VNRQYLIAVALVIAGASEAIAQTPIDGGPDPGKVRVKVGPLWMNPTIAVNDLGTDTNVFNDPPDVSPKRDFTFTLAPQTEFWMRLGRTWVSGAIREDMVWYQKYATERSANSSYELGWKVPLNRLTFSTRGKWRNTRERPGFEIDTRAARNETTFGGAAEIRPFSKTFFGVTGEWEKQSFDKTAVFRASSLRDELNHTSMTTGVTARYEITSLTSVIFSGTRAQDRFEFSSLRDSHSTAFSGSLAFDPAALLKGKATFGYRDFEPSSPDIPDFRGGTVSIDLGYTVFGTTRFNLKALRDIQYSYDVNQPYYLSTGFSASVAQQIVGPLDVVARLGKQQLAYRDRVGATVVFSKRRDDVETYGAGVGYHFGSDTRLGFNIDQQSRTSPMPSGRYRGMRYGTSITYGS
jgi:hypothetical protein